MIGDFDDDFPVLPCWLDVPDPAVVSLGNDEGVTGGGGKNVEEGEELVVFVEFVGRDLVGGDFAKDTVGHRYCLFYSLSATLGRA